MLSGIFFDIQSFTCDDAEAVQQKYHVVVSLNRNHPIFTGHFPGNPVVPGVCQVQMIRELAERAVKHTLALRESDNVKFLSMINPEVHPALEVELHILPQPDHRFSVTASILSGGTVFLKFKGKFESEQ